MEGGTVINGRIGNEAWRSDWHEGSGSSVASSSKKGCKKVGNIWKCFIMRCKDLREKIAGGRDWMYGQCMDVGFSDFFYGFEGAWMEHIPSYLCTSFHQMRCKRYRVLHGLFFLSV